MDYFFGGVGVENDTMLNNAKNILLYYLYEIQLNIPYIIFYDFHFKHWQLFSFVANFPESKLRFTSSAW